MPAAADDAAAHNNRRRRQQVSLEPGSGLAALELWAAHLRLG